MLFSHTVEETPPSLIVSTVVPESSTAVFFSGGTDVPGSPAALLFPIPDILAQDDGCFPRRKKDRNLGNICKKKDHLWYKTY